VLAPDSVRLCMKLPIACQPDQLYSKGTSPFPTVNYEGMERLLFR
jgi:hypothetical protein